MIVRPGTEASADAVREEAHSDADYVYGASVGAAEMFAMHALGQPLPKGWRIETIYPSGLSTVDWSKPPEDKR